MKQGICLRSMTIMLMVFFIAGCATSSIQTTSIDTSKPLNPDNGIVAVQVVNNTDRLSGYIENWTEIITIRVDNIDQLKQEAKNKLKNEGKTVPADDKLEWNPDTYTLRSRSSGLNDSRIFIGEMPDGEYIVNKLWSYYNDGNVSAYISMPVGFPAGTFKVEKSRFTDLGTLLFQPLLNIKKKSFWNPQPGIRAYVARSSSNLELAHLVKLVYPKLKGAINFKDPLTWKKDKVDSFREKVANISYQNLYGNKFIALTHHAKAALPTRLGRVRILDKNGEWSQLILPTQAQLLAAIDTPELIAFAGERGLIFASDSLTGNWKTSQPVDPSRAIIWLGKTNDHFAAMTLNDGNYEIYRFDNFDSAWQLIKSHKPEPGFLTATGGVFPIVTDTGTLRVLTSEQVWDYNSGNSSWSNTKGNKLISMTQLSATSLSGLETSNWDGVGDQAISFDSGSTWKIISRDLNSTLVEDRHADASLAALTTQGDLITVGRPPMVDTSFDSSIKENTNALKIVIVNSSNISDKRSWRYLGGLKQDCASIVPELTSEERIYMLCDKGQLVYTNDQGESWHTDIAIDLAAMQQSFDELIQGLKNAEKLKEAEK